MKKFTLSIAFILMTIISYGQDFYVDASVGASGDGLSAGTAFKTLAEGVSATSDGDVVQVIGGTDLTPTTTINIIGKAITIQGVSDAVIDGASSSSRLFKLNNLSPGNLTLKNLVVKNFNSSGEGAIAFVHKAATLTIEECVILDNTALTDNSDITPVTKVGGALVIKTGTVTIKRSLFKGNESEGSQGGAIWINDASAVVTIENTTFYGNKAATDGGAIFNSNGSLTLTNATIVGNSTDASLEASGGVRVNGTGTITANNCIITGNSYTVSGAASDLYKAAGATGTINYSILGKVGSGFTENNSGKNQVLTFSNEANVANNTDQVLKHTISDLPYQYGLASYLSALEDQLGFTRAGSGGVVDAGAFEFAATLSIGSFELLESGFAIYPNPVQSIATIVAPSVDAELVEIYSVIGKKVLEEEVVNGKAILDVQSLPAGIYIAKIEKGDRSVTKKFIVSK